MTESPLDLQVKLDRLLIAKNEMQKVLSDSSAESAHYIKIALSAIEVAINYVEGDVKQLELNTRESVANKLIAHARQLSW